MFYKHLTRRP